MNPSRLLLSLALFLSTPLQADEDQPLAINGCVIQPDSNCAGADLRGADLSNQDMRKMNLAGADLTDANLQESKLSEANLGNATMTGTRRHYATFQGTNMEGCIDCPTDWEK